jgi:pimeloyl-ACP methyl ester carboxylesterase
MAAMLPRLRPATSDRRHGTILAMTDETSTDDGLPQGYDRHEVRVGERLLDTLTYGPEDGSALVYHSGTPSAAAPFDLLSQAAARRGMRTITYSRPGYATSTTDEGRRVADAVGDTLAVLDALGHDSFTTMGHSGGGPHALACGALAPDRCRIVAVVAGVAPYDADGLDFMDGMGAENVVEFDLARQGGPDFEAFLAAAAGTMVALDQDGIAEALGDLVTERDREAVAGPIGAYLAAALRRAFVPGTTGWRDDDLAFLSPWGFEVGDVSVPVTIWQGSEDRMVPAAHGRWLAANLPGSRLELREAEGHLSLVELALDALLDELAAVA